MLDKKTAIILGLGFLLELFILFMFIKRKSEEIPLPKSAEIEFANRELYKTAVPKNLVYNEIYPEPNFENLNMLGNVHTMGVSGKNKEERLYGMILRTLRFKNITSRIEKRYGLPENLLLAMVMQETGGVDLLPNSSNDGGLGLCHMQPYMAKLFGLKTYQNCDKMVSTQHGLALRKLISNNNKNRKLLLTFDDRFHPILNLDAAARMLVYYLKGTQIQPTPVQTAIYGYAGRYNYPEYYTRVRQYWKHLNDKELIDKVEGEFNALNPDLKINGKPADFKKYLLIHQQQNRNYGLDFY
jgi:hypothetical protein